MSVPAPLTMSLRERVTTRTAQVAGIAGVGTIIGWLCTSDLTFVLGGALALLWTGLFGVLFNRLALSRIPSPALRRIIVAGFAVRLPLALAHLAIGLWLMGGRIDSFGYVGSAAGAFNESLQGDFRRFIPPAGDLGGWLATVMFVPVYVLLGPSLFGTFLWSSIIGFMGGFLFLRAFQIEFGTGDDTRFLATCLFFYPSVAFWSGLLGKDSLMFFFLGLSTYGLVRSLAEPRLRNAVLLCVGMAFVLVIRTPIGVALAVAAMGAALVSLRGWTRRLGGPATMLRPVAYIVLTGVIVSGTYTVVLGGLARHGVLKGESTSPVQALLNLAVERHVGLSTDPTAGATSLSVRIVEPTITGALRYLPEALLTFLFRPHIFEAHNTVALAAALDGTLLFALILWRWKHLFAAVRAAPRRPLVVYAIAAFMLFSAGLSFEANLGAIVRHRTMVMPFLFILLSVPRQRASGRERS